MTRIEKNPPLERAFSLAFHGGELRRRELRLTPEEAETLRAWADLTPMPGPEGEKRWYEVQLKGAPIA